MQALRWALLLPSRDAARHERLRMVVAELATERQRNREQRSAVLTNAERLRRMLNELLGRVPGDWS